MQLKILFQPLLFIGMFILVFTGCKKENDIHNTDHVVNFEAVTSYSANTIENTLALQTLLYPELSVVTENIRSGVTVYRISYKTMYRDSVITASGLMCIPSTPGSYPVISFQNGTNTINANAPSVNPYNSSYLLIEFLASNGYVVLMPDYIGFGASADIMHPYYHMPSTKDAVLDLIIAFNELSETGQITASPNDSLFLMGYSQGGGATISALFEIDINDRLSSMYRVIAVSAGAGAYDLYDFTKYLLDQDTYPSPFYFPYFIYSQKKYGNISASLNVFFNETYAQRIPGLFDNLHSGDAINDQLSESVHEMFTTAMLNYFETAPLFEELRLTLQDNSLFGWSSETKIHLYHGSADDNVPPSQSLNLYNSFITSEIDEDLIEYIILEGKNHETGVLPWGTKTIEWFNLLRYNR